MTNQYILDLPSQKCIAKLNCNKYSDFFEIVFLSYRNTSNSCGQ